MSTILIPSNTLRDAKRLFSRLRHTRSKLPVLTHLLVTADLQGIRLAATDLDHWLELQVSDDSMEPISFLLPPAAMDNACRADKGSLVAFTASGGRRSHLVGLSLVQGGIEVSSVHPTPDPLEFPARPAVEGETFEAPPATLQSLATVAVCASSDSSRQILNGVLFTPEERGQLVATDGRRLACTPAAVPPHSFVLPNLAVSILAVTMQ
jgi:DNA polymerase III sliding clamp (beta) subunit (PCNA family)